MRLAYGTNAYKRSRGAFPELRLINLFPESVPMEEGGRVALLSRKGLSQSASVGNGPITGVYKQAGVFSGDTFAVSGGVLYRGTSSLGTIDGSGPVSFAGRNGEVLVTAGASLWSYNGTNLAAVAFPDGASVRAVEFHKAKFLAARDGSHKWYWSADNDGRTWGALDFASAESRPDNLLDLRVVNDTLWLFGNETIEPWPYNQGATTPYAQMAQRIFSKGLHSTGCVVEMDNSLLFVAADGMAYRTADVPLRISDHGMEERIADSATVKCFGFIDEGHSFFCIRLDQGTFAFDIATTSWCELASAGRSNWRAQCATKPISAPVFGDDSTGKLWVFDGYDDDGGEMERRFTAGVPLDGGSASIHRLGIEANVGWTDLLSGQGSSPLVEMRYSRDGGATFGEWDSVPLGAQGNYRTRAEWRPREMFDPPGALFEFRCSEPIDFRVSKVTVNELGGGRA